MLLPSMWLKDWVTKVKTSKIVTFCYFWPKMGKNLALIFFKYGVSSSYSLQFSLRFLYNPYLFACKCIPHAKYEKRPIEIPVPLFFFTTLDLIWPKFCPKDHTHFTFFNWFQIKHVEDTININNLCWNPAVLKKSW